MFWLFLTLLMPFRVDAAATELELKILPLDCIFDVVEDGSNQIIYLTPVECGQVVDDAPPIVQGESNVLQPTTDLSRISIITTRNTGHDQPHQYYCPDDQHSEAPKLGGFVVAESECRDSVLTSLVLTVAATILIFFELAFNFVVSRWLIRIFAWFISRLFKLF